MLIELPFGLHGRIFRSPMPFGSYDPDGAIYPAYKQQKITIIVVLADDEECLRKAKRNLLKLYAADGFHVIHLPIPDFGVPASKDAERTMLHCKT
jgi:hypothetical protein